MIPSVAVAVLSGAALVLHRAGARLQKKVAFHCCCDWGFLLSKEVCQTAAWAIPEHLHQASSINIITYKVDCSFQTNSCAGECMNAAVQGRRFRQL